MSIQGPTRPAPAPDLDEAPSHEEIYAVVAAMCAFVAGAIHLAVVPEHWAVSGPISAFFLVLGLGQLALAAALRWSLPPWLLTAVIIGHLGVMGLYVASRTVDLPFVPPHDAGHAVNHLPVAGGVGNGIPVYPGSRVEPVGVLDVGCLIVELVLVTMLTGLLPRSWRNPVTSAMVALGVLLLGARTAGIIA